MSKVISSISCLIVAGLVVFGILGCSVTRSISGDTNGESSTQTITRKPFDLRDPQSLHMDTDDFKLITSGLPKSEHLKNIETVYSPYKYESPDLRGELHQLWSISADDYSLDSLEITSFGHNLYGWLLGIEGIGEYVYDPQSGEKRKRGSSIGYPSVDKEMYLSNASGCGKTDTMLKNKDGDTIWSVNLGTGYGKMLCDSYICGSYLITDYPSMASYKQMIGVNLLDGNADWLLRLNKSNVSLCGMHISCIHENMLWLMVNEAGEPYVLYRIDLSGDKSIGIIAYDIDNPEYATVIDDTLLVILDDMTTLLLIDLYDGRLIDQIDLNDLVPETDSRFLCKTGHTHHPLSFTDGTKYYYIDDIETYSYEEIPWPVYRIPSTEIGFSEKHYHPNGYWSADSESIYGFDTTNGERTWFIDRSDLEKSVEGVYIFSHNAVLIQHGNKLSAFGKK